MPWSRKQADDNIARCHGCGSWRHIERDCDVCAALGACQLCGRSGPLDELGACELCVAQLVEAELQEVAQ